MLPYHSALFHSQVKAQLYQWIENECPTVGRLMALPIALFSGLSYALLTVAEIVEAIAFAAINAVGALFSAKQCTFENAGESCFSILSSFVYAAHCPAAIVSVFVCLIKAPQQYAEFRRKQNQETTREFAKMLEVNKGTLTQCLERLKMQKYFHEQQRGYIGFR